MLLQIIQHTPVRIWAVLAVLTLIGLSQARPRTIGAARAALLPAAMLALSLAGVVSTFGVSALALAAWGVGVGMALSLPPRLLPAVEATWSAASDSLRVAGSWLPLALILGLFSVKYAAGASLALHPEFATQAGFATVCGFAYGLFSGIFAARGRQMWRIRGSLRV
jgi:hypothetical protein